MLQLTTATTMTWDGHNYVPGDALPDSIHGWPHLASRVETEHVRIHGDAAELHLVGTDAGVTLDGVVLRDGEYHPALATLPPRTLAGLLRRGALRSVNVPAPLAAAVCAAAARGRLKLTVCSPAAPPSAETAPVESVPAPEPQTAPPAQAELPAVDAARSPRPQEQGKHHKHNRPR